LSIVAISDFSTFSQITWGRRLRVSRYDRVLFSSSTPYCQSGQRGQRRKSGHQQRDRGPSTYGNAVGVLLTNPLGLGLALLEGVLVLELASHFSGDGFVGCWLCLEDGVQVGDDALLSERRMSAMTDTE